MTTLQRISITVVTALVLGTLRASAGELPQYEFAGFPISPVQITVLGSDSVQERAPTPTLTLNGIQRRGVDRLASARSHSACFLKCWLLIKASGK
jgi:hypothetical protein